MWLLNIDLAARQRPDDAIYIAMRTVSGALRREIERFIYLFIVHNPGQQQNAVPWNGLKDHMIQAFLGGEEIARKRDLVQTLKQKVYEN